MWMVLKSILSWVWWCECSESLRGELCRGVWGNYTTHKGFSLWCKVVSYYQLVWLFGWWYMRYGHLTESEVWTLSIAWLAMKGFICVDKVNITQLAITNDSVEHAIRVILVLQYLWDLVWITTSVTKLL